MLDDSTEVKRHLDNVIDMVSRIGEIPEDELDKLSWDVGVIGRSYYVIGAYMCQVIESRAGKETLKQTIVEGPYSFFDSYNDLVSEDEKILYKKG